MSNVIRSLMVKVGADLSGLRDGMKEAATAMKEGFGNLSMEETTAALKALNQSARVAGSEFKAAVAGMDDWSKSAEGLNARIKYLNDIIETQKLKIEGLNRQYDLAVKEFGEASKQALDLKIQINNQTAELRENEAELKDVTAQLDNFGNETIDAEGKTGKFSAVLGKMGEGLKTVGVTVGKAAVAGVAAVGTAAVAAGTAAFQLASDAGKAADELITLSNKTGISVTQLQEMQYAARFVDVDLETMTGSMAKLTRSMDSARNGSKTAEAAFAKLGVSIKNSDGSLRNSKEVWAETIDALGRVSNETERDALALQIFGRSAQELNPLIKAGSAELSRLSEEAHNVGAVLGEDAIEQAGKFDDMMQTLEASMTGLKTTIGVAAMPAITEVVQTITGIVPKITEAVKTGNWSEAGKAISEGVSGLVGKLSEALPGLLNVVSSILTGLVQAIAEAVPQVLPPLIEASIQVLQTLLQTLVDNAPMLIDAGVQALMALINGIIDSIPLLIDATIEIVFALVDGILDLLPELIPAAIELILALTKGIIDALPKLAEKIPEVVETIVNTLVDSIPLLIDAAIEIIEMLAEYLLSPENIKTLINCSIEVAFALQRGLVNAIPKIIEGAYKIARALVDTVLKTDWLSLGKNIIDGIIKGLNGAMKNIVDAIKGVAEGIFNGVKAFFGIHSPSTVMRDKVGKMLGLGLAEGIAASSKDVRAAMDGLYDEIDGAANIAVSASVKSDTSFASGDTPSGIGGSGGMDAVLGALDKLIKLTEEGQVLIVDGNVLGRVVSRKLGNLFRQAGRTLIPV